MSAKVYTTMPGAEIFIGGRLATNDTPAIVSDALAAELEEEIVGERPNPRAGEPDEPATLRIGSGPRTDIRVERDTPAPAPRLGRTPKPTPAPEPPKAEESK